MKSRRDQQLFTIIPAVFMDTQENEPTPSSLKNLAKESEERTVVGLPRQVANSVFQSPNKSIRLTKGNRKRDSFNLFQDEKRFHVDEELLNFQVQRFKYVEEEYRKLSGDERTKTFTIDGKVFIVREDHGCVLRVIKEKEPFSAVLFTSVYNTAVPMISQSEVDGGNDPPPNPDANEPVFLRFFYADKNVVVYPDGSMKCVGSSYYFRAEHFKILFLGSVATKNSLPEGTEVWALQSLAFYPSCRYVTAQADPADGSAPFNVEEGNPHQYPPDKYLFVRKRINNRISFRSVLSQRYLAFEKDGQMISSKKNETFETSSFSEVAVGMGSGV
eukprot:m.42840 g.42840  ORF g.42840 m.42840 type:complete len:330 (+) comp33393_c0_seq2:243-1232(+)